MELDKKYFEDKLAALKNQHEQAIGQVNFIVGAIKAVESILVDLNTPEKEKE
jgi:poly-gamma-glutamate capsule biosynthesis protein CapA/YwtB (metallophosphatase superfamily)